MADEEKPSFETIFLQNKRQTYYQMHKLNINDPTGEFYQEGLCALWNAHETYQPVFNKLFLVAIMISVFAGILANTGIYRIVAGL